MLIRKWLVGRKGRAGCNTSRLTNLIREASGETKGCLVITEARIGDVIMAKLREF